MKNTPLTISIFSFGYQKSGIPTDRSGNNGGFVFDCRFLPNPGREEKYRALTGCDPEVISYFKRYPQVEDFLLHVFDIMDAAVANYQERQFDHLMISFGCTGGQHRSVYCANRFAEHLKNKALRVQVQHLDLAKISL